MSVWIGEVIFRKKHRGYFHYSNTGEYAYDPIVDDPDAALGCTWPEDIKQTCDCGKKPVWATLFEGSNGKGTIWKAQVCLTCRVIVSYHCPMDWLLDHETDDDPEDSTDYDHPEHEGECPLCGAYSGRAAGVE